MKKTFLLSISFALCLNADNNLTKEQIFENKYLKDKASMQNQIFVDELYKNTKDFNLTKLRSDFNLSKEQINEKYNPNFYESTEANQSAKEVSNIRRSDSFGKEVVKNEDYILHDKSLNFSEYLGQYSNNTKDLINQMESKKHLISSNKYLNSNEKLFIVLSSSMSKQSIQNYFKLLEKVNTDVTFVLRGLVGNDVRYINPTRLYIQDLLVKNPHNKDKQDKDNFYYYNIQINPKITKQYNITKVPAIIFVKNYNPIIEDYQEMPTKADENEEVFIAYGEASVDYALKEINKEAKSEGLERLLKNMQENFYGGK
ncbi:hypothetical protein WK350_000735 [Campylobacter upsaliensis]